MRSARGAFQFGFLVDELAVMTHANHLGIRDFLASAVEARRLEKNVKGLPLAGRFAGVDLRRMAIDALLVNRPW
jgi:hypothetical protein